MGYRFQFNTVNTLAQLVDGNVWGVLDDIFNSEDCGEEIIRNIEELVKGFGRDFYTINKTSISKKKHIVYSLMDNLYDLDNITNYIKEVNNNFEKIIYRHDIEKIIFESDIFKKLYYILNECSKLLSSCKINALLIPGIDDTRFNNYLTSEELIQKLVTIHPDNTCLILQPKELPKKDELYLCNACKNINLAFNEINSWPGVLLWNKRKSIFIPLSDKNGYIDIFELFNFIYYEGNNIFELMKKYKKDKRVEYYYILHLSDLHFGKQNTNKRKTSLINLINKINMGLVDGKIKSTIISGDLVDSPKNEYYRIFNDFDRRLEKGTDTSAIKVYGNHDVYKNGNKIFTFGISCNKYTDNKINIIDELKLVIISIDSNAEATGIFAEGKIGTNQLKQIEDDLMKIKNIDGYLRIAVLHHHPVKIQSKNKIQDRFKQRVYSCIEAIQEQGLILKDANEFIEWVNKMNIKLVLHGHKHVYNFNNEYGADIIGCGSSIGNVDISDRNENCLTFNLIKVNKVTNIPEVCLTYNKIIENDVLHIGSEILGGY